MMTPDQYAERLEAYRQKVQRLIEIDEARQARENALRIEVEALRVKFDWLESNCMKILANCHRQT